MLNLHPDLGVYDDVFGTEATVTVPGGAPVVLPVIPDSHLGQSVTIEGEAFILDSAHFDLRKDLLAAVPIGTTILAARVEGQTPKTWKVIRLAALDPEYTTALVL